MLFASHRTCFPDLDRLSQFVPQLTLPFSPTAILFSHSLLLYDIDFIHNSLPPILGPRPRWVSVSLCIKSQSSSYLSQGGWARTTNCLGVYSCESVLHSLWLSLFSHTGFSQSIIRLSRRPQLCTLLWESSPNTATKPTPLPSSMNTNQTSLVRFCEASLQQASMSEMFISDVVCCCARRLSHTQYYASLIKQIVLYLFICIHLGVNASKIPQGG